MRWLEASALLIASVTCSVATLECAQFHVSPGGSPGGNGGASHPWDLQTALNQPRKVHPGDTLWLHGGTYRGTFKCRLQGTASHPIIVRQVPGERATIDGGDSNGDMVFFVDGAYTWYWGFEVTSSDPNRISQQAGSWPTDIGRGEGIFTSQEGEGGRGCRFINLKVHDTRQGLSFWKEAADAEVYGCIIYHNGWCAPDRTHGHGMYCQNREGTKRLIDNIVVDNFNHGIQIYGSSNSSLDNFVVEGNVVAGHPGERDILIGGGAPVRQLVFRENLVYDLPDGVGVDIGWNRTSGAGASDVTFEGNYIAASTQIWDVQRLAMRNNTFLSPPAGVRDSDYPENAYLSAPPAENAVFVRPNRYEQGRAHIVIYNWRMGGSVAVDLSQVLRQGEAYVIRDARDYFGDPVASGTYAGAGVSIPMNPRPSRSAPEPPCRVQSLLMPRFGVFVVERTAPAHSQASRRSPARHPPR